MTELQPDERQVLDAYRRVRERQFGDNELSVSHGKLVKLCEVVKNSVQIHTLREVITK